MPAIRIHEPSGLPMHDDGREYRVLGALRPSGFCALPDFSAGFDIIPMKDWQEFSLREWAMPIWNQGQHGSCVGQGTGTAFTYAWLVSGQTPHEFSPTSVYAQINGGQDQGAQVRDGLACLKSKGISLMSLFGQDKIYLSQLSQQAQETALRFRVVEAYKINNWLELGTALMRGQIVVSGIAVGNNFSVLDRNGVAPLPDSVVGGHCMAHIGLKKFGATWVVETQNSWGTAWGRSGFCYLQEGAWHPSYGFPFDAFAIGGVYDDSQDTETDPVILS